MSVPSYLRHSSGQARVIINGKAYYLGKFGSKASKQRYDTLIAEWLASGRSSTFGIASDALTLSHLMLDYLKHCRQHYVKGENSEHIRTKYVLKVVRSLYAELPAAEFGPLQFKAVRQKLVDSKCAGNHSKTKKPAKPLSRTYVNTQMKRVARMFRWAAAEGIVPASVYDSIRLIPSLQRGRTTARETERVRPVEEALVNETIKHCSPVVAGMIRFQLLTGCRPAEVCRLTPAMIDRRADVLHWPCGAENHSSLSTSP